MNIFATFLLAFLAEATDPSSDTIVSIKSASTWIDVSTLPQRMNAAGFEVNETIAHFLQVAHIEDLSNIKTQIVKTSNSTVSSDSFCDFVADASTKLSLKSDCAEDINAPFQHHEASAGGTRSENGRVLHVNDPDAHYQNHFRRLKMGEVWQLSLPHVKREVKVAAIDSGIDWEDEDFSPVKGRFKRKSGGYIDGGWNFMTNSSNVTDLARHGTYVCRVLAAKSNNSYGMAGIAPNVSLVALQVGGRVGARVGRVLAALNMVIDLEVDIVTVGTGYQLANRKKLHSLVCSALYYIQKSGILLVSGAPNVAKRADDEYPCWFGGPLSICVTAQGNNKIQNVLASGVAWGERVDLATYGKGVFVGRDETNETAHGYGTSFSIPIVAGIAAILLSMGVEPIRVKPLMLRYADPLVPKSPKYFDRIIRGGALNPLNTIKAAIDNITSRA